MKKNEVTKRHHKPILLNSWGDFYTLGIFAKKTNLIPYAVKNLSWLRKEGEKLRLFYKGVAEADNWTFNDLAFEIAKIRELTIDRFDDFILNKSGFRVLAEMQDALKDVHDWETEEMIDGGHEFEQHMIERFRRTNDAMAIEATA